MAISKIPASTTLADQQYIQVSGPDSILSGFAYDKQTKSLYSKETQVVLPSFHGVTHIGEDPVPNATCDSPGLLSSTDKCKLDAMLQMRVGVLGFQGAGFPDDGGWINGDLILAAGSEFISIERIGNVVRFTIDNPVPLNCVCESCAQIYWIQDETEVSALRPPSCAGKLPGVNAYGELKIYLMPESVIVNPANPTTVLNTKGNYPSLIFKRYDDSISPGLAEIDVVLQRDQNNLSEAYVGWAMTPGPTSVPECVWTMGNDSDGNRIRFELSVNSEPGLLGHLLYKGHLLTKAMATITNYTSQVLTTNQYKLKMWDIVSGETLDDEFTATNVWRYENPEGPTSGSDAKALVKDKTIGLLDIGTLVDIWFFQVGEVSGTPIRRYFFNKQPPIKAKDLWDSGNRVQFGDTITARAELTPSSSSTDKTSSESSSTIRDFERSIWGITGFDSPLILFADAETGGPTESSSLNSQHLAKIDTALPGLIVESSSAANPFSERPVSLWNRSNYGNMFVTVNIGRPSSVGFPPYDILLRAPIDNHDNIYVKAIGKGTFTEEPDKHWLIIKGTHFRDLPEIGSLRILTSANNNEVWNFTQKLMFPSLDDDGIVLVSDTEFPGTTGDVMELLHQEFNSPCVRVEFGLSGSTWQVQFKVGTLDMSKAYEDDVSDDVDDYVRGMAGGYAVSSIYTQAGTFTGVGTKPVVNSSGFVLYDGGFQSGGSQPEYWNKLEIMYRDSQVWIWWNGLLVPPNSSLSSALSTPVSISTPYFPLDSELASGKFGMRLWPGAKVRDAIVKGQITLDSEYTRGQLELA